MKLLIITNGIILMALIGLMLCNVHRKFNLVEATVVSVILALLIGMYFFGGQLAWIRFIMNAPIPESLKGILFGW